jgi:hypothetical protein
MTRRRVCALIPVIAAVALAGCSADQYAGRMAVSGAVTLAGQPLKDGSIIFVPLDAQGTESGAAITAGAYTVPRESGLKPGKYLVRITAGDGRTPDTEAEAAAPGGSTNIVSVDLVPADWNTRSKHEVEVKADGANKFDFNIPTVNPRARRR